MIAILRVNLGMGDHELVAFLKIMQLLNPIRIERRKAGQGSRIISADGDGIIHEVGLTSVIQSVYGAHDCDRVAI